MASLRPIIAICGTTGVGKSKLAVELALRITEGAVVINADAMQVYEGLDIITNKLPSEEMMGIPHLLMGYKKPGEQYVVGQWVEEAARAVSLWPFIELPCPLTRFAQDRWHSRPEQDPNRGWRHLLLDTALDISRSSDWEGLRVAFHFSAIGGSFIKTDLRRERLIRKASRFTAIRFDRS
jgi:hypothetical protein